MRTTAAATLGGALLLEDDDAEMEIMMGKAKAVPTSPLRKGGLGPVEL